MSWKPRTKFARTLVDSFLAAVGKDPAAEAFITQAAQDAAPDELPELTPEALAGLMAEFWTHAAERKGKGPVIRRVTVEGCDLDRLEILQDDAPFLVDSVMGEIAEHGLSVRAMFHPVVAVRRDRKGIRGEAGTERRESMIQVILDGMVEDRDAGLIEGIKAALSDTRAAVDDFPAMLDLMGRTLAELQSAPATPARAEDIAFLSWLRDEHFVYLGARVYDYPRLADGSYAAAEPLFLPENGLGVLRDPDRSVLRRASEPAVLSPAIAKRIETDPPVVVAKSNIRSRVHRRGYMDYIGIKRYGPDGKPSGEVRFVGLFTSEAYDEPAHAVPLIRAKVAEVLKRAGQMPGSHNAKRLRNILEAHPRDELFQATVEDLLSIALAILHLYDRPRIRLFERRDPYDRFTSIFLYVPRERSDSGLRARAGELLAQAYGGRISAYYPQFSDTPLARVHFIIGFTPGHHRSADLKKIEAEIAALARTWDDRLETALRGSGEDAARVSDRISTFGHAFPAGYRDRYDAAEALADMAVIESLVPGESVRVRAYRRAEDDKTQLRFKLYRLGEPATLADVLPILEDMGLKAMVEFGFPVTPTGTGLVWIHDFEVRDEQGEHLVFADLKAAFEQAFTAVWSGQTESDGFNRLVMELSLSWREAALMRALARYRGQSGLDPSQRVQEQALSNHPGVARLILDLFRTRFHPAIQATIAERQAQGQAVMAEITEALQHVDSLDDDRVLRRLALLVNAIQRTNYYQLGPDGQPRPYISFKVASGQLADLPLPKPYREIFVWATHVEGVHLRFGPVARGGLRWSDRRDDFRTEVLGLAKAQQVKNAVIVPVGSKGGFYPKQLPKGGSAEAVRNEAIRAYRTFLSGLLDITDNLTPEGKVIHPDRTVVHDGDDPYLVVAADKGTATFSDIANGIAQDYGFWLGDAFASGGSAGYDHKVMGITARGAWEAVKRHFRELGKDIQAEPFSVVGVGDMSGDVFGNGMLLSTQTRLLAAFDHRHIFIDPDPDVAKSFAERTRMFALPRSSWDDYDRKAISKGGGVFARSLKSIPLTPEIRSLLSLTGESVSPNDLMTAILKAPAELLYLGGIGTYVKARGETQMEAGDKANDAIRVNGSDLRVKVVGEGANLGLTQAGRIEFARAGGRINTDAIDNSAGVDSSDHEVNIKIVTGVLERTGVLDRPKRDRLLKSMTDDVASHVLAHNYGQTLALSLMDQEAPQELAAHSRFMIQLETAGRLDRGVEGLPDNGVLADRRQAGQGLTRPEEAVLLAYGKLELSREIVGSAVPDDPWLEDTLLAYFPKPLRKYEAAIQRHRLRPDIIATVIANDVVNRCGPSFPGRLMAAAACDVRAFVTGYEAAKVVLDLPRVWDQVGALDGQIPAPAQMALYAQLVRVLRGETFWLARRAAREGGHINDLIRRYGPGTATLKKLGTAILSPVEQARSQAEAEALVTAGAPRALAEAVACLQPLTVAVDLVDLADASSWSLGSVARLYHQVGAAMGFDRLRAAAGAFRPGDSFERTAVRRLMEELLGEQAALTRAVMAFAGNEQAGSNLEAARKTVTSWTSLHHDATTQATRATTEIEAAGGVWSFAKLTIANAALRELVAETTAHPRKKKG